MVDDPQALLSAMHQLSDSTSRAADKYATAARQFADMRPLKRVTYFGFGLVTTAVASATGRALAPIFDFSTAMTFWMFGAGVLLIVVGAAAEAALTISMGRRLEREAGAHARKSEELEQQARGWRERLFG